MVGFLKTTVLGGVMFLIPIVVLIAIIIKAMQITGKLAIPIANALGVEAIIGMATAELLAVAILVLICFMTGLAAKTSHAKRFVRSLEVDVLEKIPAYHLLKAKTQSVLSLEETDEVSAVLARFDDSWQVAFEVERIEGVIVVIFLPGAPDPWAGSVCFMDSERITPLNLTPKSTVRLMKLFGRGSIEALANGKTFLSSSGSKTA